MQTCITYQLHLTLTKQKRINVYKTETLTRSCKEIEFPYSNCTRLNICTGQPPRPWGTDERNVHWRHLGQ